MIYESDSSVQFSGNWKDGSVGDDMLGTMGYTTPELEYIDKTILCRYNPDGCLRYKYIEYCFESWFDRLFLEWHPGKTLSGYLSEEKLALAKEVEVAGNSAYFVPYDEEEYGDSLGT